MKFDKTSVLKKFDNIDSEARYAKFDCGFVYPCKAESPKRLIKFDPNRALFDQSIHRYLDHGKTYKKHLIARHLSVLIHTCVVLVQRWKDKYLTIKILIDKYLYMMRSMSSI